MAKRVATAQPTVIQTELRPLDESFWIEGNSQLEQWYYQNTDVFMPDRQIAPLTLTPKLSALDPDREPDSQTGKVEPYEPDFVISYWKVKSWNGTAWVEQTITSTSASDDFYKSGKNLVVRKNNYDAAHAINITCRAYYADPRDSGVTNWVESSIMLSTSVDATQVFPTIEINNPSARPFNPLKDNPIFEFEGTADWSALDAQGGLSITEYKVDPLGTEEILPSNDDMVINAAPLLDIKYGDTYIDDGTAQHNHVPQQFMHRQVSGGLVNPIAGNMANITNIKGSTVKVIQVADWTNVNTLNGVYGTASVSNGVTTCTPNSSGQILIVQNNETLVYGHKFYISLYYKTSRSDIRLGWSMGSGSTEFGSAFDASPSNFTSRKVVVTLGVNSCKGISFYGNTTGSQNNLLVQNIICLDLTEMGIDSLTTTSQVDEWLATHIGNLDYIPYTSGKLISFGGYGVKMNQLVKNGNFEDNSVWIGYLSTFTIAQNVATVTLGSDSNAASQLYQTSFSDMPNHAYYARVDINPTSSGNMRLSLSSSLRDNITNLITNTWNRFSFLGIGTPQEFSIYLNTSGTRQNGDVIKVKNVVLIDLTQMFGEGNEPSKDWCDAHFTQDYYPYCPSYDTNVMNISGTKLGVKSVGFNLWDEELLHNHSISSTNGVTYEVSGDMCSKNFVKVEYGNTYFLKVPSEYSEYVNLRLYDIGQNYIGYTSVGGNGSYTPASGVAYIKFNLRERTYNNDICINLSNAQRNGTYEAHWESVSDMSWVSKLGIENFNLFNEQMELGRYNYSNTSDAGKPIASNDYIRSKDNMPIPVEASTQYYIRIGKAIGGTASTYGAIVFYYDSNLNYLSRTSDIANGTFTTPNNCAYIKFYLNTGYGTTYLNDICINKSIAHFNGRYVPYGETALYFPNGMCNAGSVYDEVKVEGGKIKGVVRFGGVNLENLSWSTSSGVWFANLDHEANNNIVSSKYIVQTTGSSSSLTSGQINARDNNGRIYVGVSSDPQPTGMLVYQLVTPYEFEIDYPTKGEFEWYGISNGSEVKIDTLPCYQNATQPSGYGQGTSKININALYGEDISVILRMKRYPTDQYPMPMKVTKSVAWKIPPLSVVVVSDKGSAVRATNQSTNFTFSTIVNQQGEVIPDDVKQENMVFTWYYQKFNANGTAQTPVSLGTGLTKVVAASTLKNTRPNNSSETPSTNVYCEASVLGAYHLVNGQYVRD